MKTLHRRTVLRGLGGAAIALPFLDIMTPPRAVRAQSGITKLGKNGRPKRFVMVATLNGQGARWFDNTTGADGLQLGPVMAPMEKHGHRKDLILIDGINNMLSNQGHGAGFGTVTTCVPNKAYYVPGGISIDQAIAQEIAGTTKFKSIQFAIENQSNWDCLSTSLTGPIYAMVDPEKAFVRLFADLQTNPMIVERAKAQRRSILDGVRADYEQFIMRLGREDKIKLQAHLDAVRGLEARLAKIDPVPSGACTKPTINDHIYTKGDSQQQFTERFITHGHIYMDLVAMAFACDLSRVATVAWNNVDTTGGPVFSWLPGSPLYHNLSHGPADGKEWNDASTWLVGYMAGFIDRLKASQDGPGPGSVWDNTVFYWTSEIGTGNSTNYRQTCLVAGSGGGYLKTNQRLVLPYTLGPLYGQVNKDATGYGDLYVSFLNAMGVPATTFGAPEFCKGPLPQLVA